MHRDNYYQLGVDIKNLVGLTASNVSLAFRLDPIPPMAPSGLQISFPSATHSVTATVIGATVIDGLYQGSSIPETLGINVTWDVSDYDSGLDTFSLEVRLDDDATTAAKSLAILNESASRVWLVPNLAFGDQSLHGRLVSFIGTAQDVAGNVASDSRVVKIDLSAPQPVAFDPVPAVFQCAGRKVVTDGAEGAPLVGQVVALDKCAFPLITRSNCVAMLDRLEYSGLDPSGFAYEILYPDDNNGVSAVKFDCTSYRDVSLYPSTAYVGVTFLCGVPNYVFSVARCLTKASTAQDALLLCPNIPPSSSLASYFFAAEGFDGTYFTWAYAYAWPASASGVGDPVPPPPSSSLVNTPRIVTCSISTAPGNVSSIDSSCLPSAPVYASVMSLITPGGLGGRRVLFPFNSRQSLPVLEAGYSKGGLAANSSSTLQLQTIQFPFAFTQTSDALLRLGYADLSAVDEDGSPTATGRPRLALKHKRHGREVWFPLGTGSLGDVPVILDASMEDLEFRFLGLSDRESSMLASAHQVFLNYVLESQPEYFPTPLFARVHPSSFSRNELENLLYVLPRKSYVPGTWYFLTGSSADGGYDLDGPVEHHLVALGSEVLLGVD
jgi:hypothetical protein